MRCEHDTFTVELPGIAELPAKPPKTTQAERMQAMAYQGPKQRRRCESCRFSCIVYLNPDSLAVRELIRCSVGDFPVLRGGICDEWEPA